MLGFSPAYPQGQTSICYQISNVVNGVTTYSCQPVNAAHPLPSSNNVGAAKASAASGTTGVVTANIAATSGVTNYLCSFSVSAIGGSAAVGPITVTGLLGGTLTYQLASTATGITLLRNFTPCLPASAVNTAIVITTTANGTATAVNVDLQGFQL
jgi:hypothetical protein